MGVGVGGCASRAKISELYLLSDSRGGCEGGVVSVENLRIGGRRFKKMSGPTPYGVSTRIFARLRRATNSTSIPTVITPPWTTNFHTFIESPHYQPFAPGRR